MKMILEFTDVDRDEQEKFKRAVTADDAYSCLWEVNNRFGELLKDRAGKLSDVEYELISKVAKEIGEIYADNKIDLDLWS